jgi:hypothetical protein
MGILQMWLCIENKKSSAENNHLIAFQGRFSIARNRGTTLITSRYNYDGLTRRALHPEGLLPEAPQ